MTQEQKDKMEQEVKAYTIPYIRNHGQRMGDIVKQDFTSIYQTILDNPQEWFPPVQYWQLRDENERLQSELSRYREALEEIEYYCDNQNPTHEVFWKIAKEALKQEESDTESLKLN